MRKLLMTSSLLVLSFASMAYADSTSDILSRPAMSSWDAAPEAGQVATAPGFKSTSHDTSSSAPAGITTRAVYVPVSAQSVATSPATRPVGVTEPVQSSPAVMPAPTPAPEPAPAVVSDEPPAQSAAADVAAASNPLLDILSAAYTSSPTLRAQREELRQQYENVALADSRKRPVVTAEGGVAWVSADTDPGTRDDFISGSATLNVQQYLYRGGRTLAQIEQQLRLSESAMAAYDNATQNTFLSVITAAMDIQQARATIELTQQNRTVIDRQLQTATRGFDVGELTRTDVAQAQARLSGAEAQLVSSNAEYSSAIARFQQFSGQDGSKLDISADGSALALPSDLEAARAIATAQHPAIRAARESEKAAQQGIKVAEGALLPEVFARGSAATTENPSATIDRSTDAQLALRAVVPLYEGGATHAQIRQAKYVAYEQKSRIEDATRQVEQAVTTAWNDYEAARSAITAREKQVSASEIARSGVYKEREVGTRTVLDTLDADAELLDAQVALVRARRDAVVAAYALMAATGQLTAEKLGFMSGQDERERLAAARASWFGTATDARP